MNHLDLFSGIGGFHLAGEMVWGKEFNTICHVEIDPFCQKVLKKHWPDVPIVEDIRDVEQILAYTKGERSEGKTTRTTVDILTGGFPCQGFSVAGKRRGKEDDRYLWPEMFKVIQEVRPNWIIGENVTGIIDMALDTVLSDLEAEGYSTQTFIIPACAVDAPHRRDRVWIVAYSKTMRRGRGSNSSNERWKGMVQEEQKRSEMGSEVEGCSIISRKDVADTLCERMEACWNKEGGSRLYQQGESDSFGNGNSSGARWLPEPKLGRVAHGISNRVDRLKSLGNAIVPQVVIPIMKVIKNETSKSN